MLHIRMIIADIDNTLVPKYGDVQPFTNQMIQAARKQGMLFGLASGRPLFHCIDLCKRWQLSIDFLICNNGCNIYDVKTQKIENADLLKPEWCKEIIDLMSSFDTNLMMYWDNKTYCTKQDDMVQDAGNVYHYDYVVTSDLSVYCKPIEKLMFRIDQNDIDQAEQVIRNHPSPYYKGFRTQPIMLEFCAKTVSKGNALKRYCAHKHIDLQEVCAFGDTENDEDMMRISGLGVCMSNGSASTKAIADALTEKDCQHEGVGSFIRDHLLAPH